ncbi:leucine-rich repeat extensin-like protein 7 isoform X2 [Cucurbita pepo subsp. pepo]|uniref:leucine-rich repeat extensin-like protein 7 isoform X2 n=1 Tax=Cucurbita pepo subsp. pepo TaxID=3664 RepID=UPI000C9D2809|nr:leucine-rich repeat extensin-like protein 7 isoform X2 [Cucurbita pepo subsp. pepo]
MLTKSWKLLINPKKQRSFAQLRPPLSTLFALFNAQTKASNIELVVRVVNSKMECWVFFSLFLSGLILPARAIVGVGGGVRFGFGGGGGGGGGGIWVGGGGNTPNPTPTPTPNPLLGTQLNRAYSVLQTWKSAISDDPTGILTTWVGSDVCSYQGIFCTNHSSGQISVTGIDLNGKNLRGSLIKDLAFLTDLTLIHLNSNRFSGTIPVSFRQLQFLQELDLSNNNFSGEFPAVTLYIPNLKYLDLRFNSFTGPIPEELFFKELDAIFINDNQFTGEIPQNLGNSPASVINLANNHFVGEIPASFGYMGPRLKEILFLNNQLTGCIPEGVGFLTEIEVLDFSSNKLFGHLPDTISCMNQVEILNLAHNELSGVVSDLVCSLRSLVNLSVADNFFSGFNQQCRNLFGGFDLSFNCIPGVGLQRPSPECSRPSPECSVIPGIGLSCLRVPGLPRPLVCGRLVETPAAEAAAP